MLDFKVLGHGFVSDFRHGLLKLLLMRALERKEMHGYGLIKRVEYATDGQWKPSPGSLYPALRSLEKEKLITSYQEGNRVVYKLTKEGRQLNNDLRENVDDLIASVSAIFNKI